MNVTTMDANQLSQLLLKSQQKEYNFSLFCKIQYSYLRFESFILECKDMQTT